MATAIPISEVSRSTALNPSTTDIPTGGLEFSNTGAELLFFKNTHSGTVVVTAVTPQTVDGLAVADRTWSLATDEEAIVGPFPPVHYNNSSGKMVITADTVDVVETTAFRIPVANRV